MNVVEPKLLEFRIPAETRYIAVVRRGVRSLAESLGFAREEVCDVEVAVCEAVTNSMIHGPQTQAAVFVKCRASGDSIIVEIEDQNRASIMRDQSFSSDHTNEHGRGILMMKALMDECEDCITESGTRVRMAKQKSG